MLNRRSFLALLGSTAIAPLLPAIASEGQYRPANLLTQGQVFTLSCWMNGSFHHVTTPLDNGRASLSISI